jgi:hypothetical protein
MATSSNGDTLPDSCGRRIRWRRAQSVDGRPLETAGAVPVGARREKRLK